jgi:hypothetical protein
MDEGPSVTLLPCYKSTWHHTIQEIVILVVTAMRIPTSVIFGVFQLGSTRINARDYNV